MPNAEFFYWSKSEEPGKQAWAQITEWITHCDLFIVVITGHSVQRGLAVGKEVGVARNQAKKILPLVCTRVPDDEITFLEGIPYEAIDLLNPDQAVQRVMEVIAKLYEKRRLEREALLAQQQQIQIRKDSQVQLEHFRIAVALVVVVLGIILLTRKS